jgi:uncharacterized protein YraI
MRLTPLHVSFSRGSAIRVLAAIVLIVTTVAGSVGAKPGTTWAAATRTTDSVNLRSGPGTKYRVIRVIPAGDSLKITGSYSHGFYPVRYDGAKGWVSEDYLVMPRPIGSARATDSVNLRAGPSTRQAILLTIPSGAGLKITGSLSKGFYPVRYQGIKGWVYADYLAPGKRGSGSSTTPSSSAVSRPRMLGLAHTMDSLNLRTGPGTNYGVILTIPDNGSLTITGSYRNGYYPVRYQGTKGWVSGDYLALGGPKNDTWTHDELVELVFDAAVFFGEDGSDMLRVAECESNLDPKNVTPPHSASGLFQFLPGTWKTTPYADRSVFDPEANAYAAAWMWSVGRRSEWVCQ